MKSGFQLRARVREVGEEGWGEGGGGRTGLAHPVNRIMVTWPRRVAAWGGGRGRGEGVRSDERTHTIHRAVFNKT